MQAIKTSRRHVVAGLVLGSGAAAMGHAQETIELSVDASTVRAVHRRSLDETGTTLGTNLALSRAGLDEALTTLLQQEVIGGGDFETLRRFLAVLFDTSSLSDLIEAVLALYEQTIEGLGNVAKVIAAVVADSADYARERLANLPIDTAVLVIAHDFRGGLDGALTGAGLGAVFPAIGPLTGALLGGLVAGVSDSIIGYHDFAGRAR